MNSKTGYVFQEEYVRHELSYGHPESPERLKAVKKKMRETGLDKDVHFIDPLDDKEEVLEALSLVHSQEHTHSVLEHNTTGDIAFLAAAGVLGAVKKVMDGMLTNAFCAVRPPGHHAHNNGIHCDGRYQGEGFCFFNNAAIGARYAQKKYGCKSVLILDWDYHHGNGTEWAFYSDPSVFFFSTHILFGYPGTGYPDKTGSKTGSGYNLNIPLPPYAEDSHIINAWEKELIPALKKLNFKPDLIIISAGFDSREGDILGNFRITDKGFSKLTEIAMELAQTHCSGKLVSVLEGGYNPEGLANGVFYHIKTLLNSK
ncbi:MAG: histone deacetylase [Chitinispirillia bacterium]